VRVQSQFAAVVMRPLNDDWQMQTTAADGRATADVAAEFIKPNDRLTSFERIELYNRQYWFRLIDVFYEDYPGLATILGEKRFNRLCKEYLIRYPSKSGLLRFLGRKLEDFIEEEPQLTEPQTEMALDMARFEWAQLQAFDGAKRPPLTPDDLLGKDPAQTYLKLQPYLTLLHTHYAVDHLLIAVKKQELRGEASNASNGTNYTGKRRRSAKAEEVFLAVHRLDNLVYIKRLDSAAYAILAAIRDGATLTDAIAGATPPDVQPEVWAGQLQEWFKTWMSFGWFCRKH
jgi:hypothetical protein